MVDYVKALIDYLKADASVSALVGTRVYGGELPVDEIDNQPRKAIVIVLSGGESENDYRGVARPSVDIYCYGENYYEAGEVDRAVYDALKSIDRESVGTVLIHSVVVSGGAIQLRDDLGWAIMWRGYTLAVGQDSL